MPIGDMIFVVRFLYTDAFGVTAPHAWYRRVKTGRDGIELRDRIVSTGTRADDRVVVTECKFYPLTGEGKAAA